MRIRSDVDTDKTSGRIDKLTYFVPTRSSRYQGYQSYQGYVALLKARGTDSDISVVANISSTAASIGANDLRHTLSIVDYRIAIIY
ncbi:hypothetical protein ACS0TY_000518 [Phlomoides rotata]